MLGHQFSKTPHRIIRPLSILPLHKDDLAHEPWLAIAHLNDRESGTGKIFLAAPLNPTDLQPFLKEHEVIDWNNKKGGLVAAREMRIGSIVLKSTPIQNPDQASIQKALSKAIIRNGESLLNFDKNVTQWQNRVNTVRKWYPKDEWPDVSTQHLLDTNDNVYRYAWFSVRSHHLPPFVSGLTPCSNCIDNFTVRLETRRIPSSMAAICCQAIRTRRN